MRNQTIYFLLLVFITLTTSCSNDDDSEPIIENLKNVSDCGITIEPDTLISICIDGTDLALPNETITFASTFYSKNDNPSDTQFLWTVESGNMEILNIENSIDGTIAKSIATIKFNSDYIGNGVIGINAENATGTGIIEHFVELEN
jgi:hypothetical protein